MNPFVDIPVEIYQKTLFHLDPQDLKAICLTDKNTESICNDYFWQKYIILHYGDSVYEKYLKYVNRKLINWKTLALSEGKYIHVIIDDTGEIFLIEVKPDTTISEITKKIDLRMSDITGIDFYVKTILPNMTIAYYSNTKDAIYRYKFNNHNFNNHNFNNHNFMSPKYYFPDHVPLEDIKYIPERESLNLGDVKITDPSLYDYISSINIKVNMKNVGYKKYFGRAVIEVYINIF